jgi:ABC-type transporter Mla subunit MlaD
VPDHPHFPEIHNHYHFHHHDAPGADVVEALDAMRAQVEANTLGLYSLTQSINTLEDNTVADLSRLTTEVSENTSVTQSAITLLGNLADLIRQNATDEAALNDLADSLDANSNALAAAVEANTPATPEPEPTPEP